MKVYIDSREQEMVQKLISYYEQHKEDYSNIESIEVKTLPSGDLCTEDNYFGCERKSTVDFISSVTSGKIKQQLLELRNTYQNSLFIVEGYDGMFDCITKNTQVHPKVILGVTTSAIAHNGVPIQYVGGFYIPFVLDTINKLYDGKMQQYETFGYTPIRRSVNKENFIKYFVSGLPGIKSTITPKIMKKFNNSVSNIVNATEEELMEVEGIGKEKARKIKEVLK